MSNLKAVQRQNGVALWRQIADRIRAAIGSGSYDDTGMIPPEMVLAEEFGVNRHTVRSALAALAREGLVRAEQGRGTMIVHRQRYNFPISRRTRFTEGIASQARDIEGLLLGSAVEEANPAVCRGLELEKGAPVMRMELLRKADHRPVSISTSWFPLPRFSGMLEAYRASGSITRAFAECDLPDYIRRSTEISAMHAEPEDVLELQLSPGAIVLVTTGVNTDLDGRPVQFAVTRFPADHVQLTVSG